MINLDVASISEDDWFADVQVNDTKIAFKLDSGAQGNIIPLHVYNKISPKPKLHQMSVVLTAFTRDSRVKPVGIIECQCTNKSGTSHNLSFYVTDKCDMSLMGRKSSEQLGLIKRVDAMIMGSELTLQKLTQLYPGNMKGLGILNLEYDIQVDDKIPGEIQHAHKVPYPKREKLKATLENMKKRGVISSVDKPTPWVSNLVIVEKKNGAFRLCLDPKNLNKAIKREHTHIPTPEGVQTQLAGKTVFSVFDMRDSYWQVKLSEDSSYYTTFHTPWGRKRFLRMPFGICSASEVLQKRLYENFGDIDGIHNIHDDILVAGVDEKEHDEIVHRFMKLAEERGVKFNLPKTQFKVNRVKYVGNYVTDKGLVSDPDKIEAIINMPIPDDKPALQRLLGMVKYLSQFIPNESEITAPLRGLLKEDAEWSWHPEHFEAIEKLKTVLTSSPVLQYYDVNKEVTIQADASQKGLGTCLIQENKPVAYASRSLTSAEQNYVQLEKELLAICFACQQFSQFIRGKQVNVQSDHKPLEIILKKPIAKASPRVQRMMLKLQRYNITVTYLPGKQMFLADTLSRAYIKGEPDKELEEEIDVMVNSVMRDLPASAGKLDQIRKLTDEDSSLQNLKQIVMEGWPESRKKIPSDLYPYWNIRDEITVSDGILLAGSRIIMPAALRSEMLQRLHESHLGMEKSKARVRAVMYWPNLSKDIEDSVAQCAACLKYRPANQREPMIPHDIPDTPFTKIAMDICTFQGAEYLVVVDYYSKYPEVARLGTHKTAGVVISHLKGMLTRHGIPEEIVSDNMPFNSAQFRKFAQEWNITLSTSSPTYPQSNGQAERMVETVKQLLYKADEAGIDPYIALLEYRNTPISGLQYSPAQLAMSRQLRSKLPVAPGVLKP